MSSRELKIAVIASHPNQHFYTAFQALAKLSGVNLRVIYCFNTLDSGAHDFNFGMKIKWDIPLLEGYPFVVLNSEPLPMKMGFLNIDSQKLIDELEAYSPDCIWVFGYNYLMTVKGILWAAFHKIPLFFLSDSEMVRGDRPIWIKAVKRIILPLFLKLCSRFITVGDNNEKYYRSYGIPNSKMIRGCCPIGISRFSLNQAHYEEKRTKTRKELSIASDEVVLVFSAKLIEIKRPLDLVDACRVLKMNGRKFKAIFLGAGPLRDVVAQKISALQLEDEVRLLGFVNQLKIPDYLMAGDIAIVPSEVDPHPLAVTEAMASGQTAIVSDRVGCVGPTDVLKPEVTGLTYPCGNPEALAATIERLILDPALLKRLRQDAKKWVQNQSPQFLAHAIIQAAISVADEPSCHLHALSELRENLKDSMAVDDSRDCSSGENNIIRKAL